MNINLRDIGEGKLLTGELPPEIITLEDDLAVPTSGVRFEVNARPIEEELFIEGSLSADFELVCTRCTGKFAHTVDLNPYYHCEEIKNQANVDLTDQVREDILLALPGYPHCDAHANESRTCPMEGRFEAKEATESDQADTGDSAWEALDHLQTQHESKQK